jgi:hypothetical protein
LKNQKAFISLEPYATYITINISCPNSIGGQPFINSEKLNQLLTTLDTIPTQKPIFIKFSPDMNDTELDALLDVARAHRVHGIICANLSKKRDNLNIFETQHSHVLWHCVSTIFVAMDHHVVQLAWQAAVELALQQKERQAVGPPQFQVSM